MVTAVIVCPPGGDCPSGRAAASFATRGLKQAVLPPQVSRRRVRRVLWSGASAGAPEAVSRWCSLSVWPNGAGAVLTCALSGCDLPRPRARAGGGGCVVAVTRPRENGEGKRVCRNRVSQSVC